MTQIAAEFVSIERLLPWAKNPRKNDPAVDALVASIQEFGFGAPIVARRANCEVIAGHTRLKAAIRLGLTEVPVRFLDLTEQQAHRLALADNKLGEIAEWDGDLLRELAKSENLTELGWTEAEVRDLLKSATPAEPMSFGDGVAPHNPERRIIVQLLVAVQDAGPIEAAIEAAVLRLTCSRGEALSVICKEWMLGSR